jgi:hypothetical protein
MKIHKVLIFLLFIVVGLFGDSRAQISAYKRPDPNGRATKINSIIYVGDISKINDAEQGFSVDFYILLRWRDSREMVVGRKKIEDVWNPLLVLFNARNIKKQYEDVVDIDGQGNVSYFQRFTGTISLPMNLRKFPFDRQELPIIFLSRYSPDEVEFITERFKRAEKISIANWIIDSGEIVTDSHKIMPGGSVLTRYTLKFSAHRRIGFYISRVIIPLMLIVFMSWSVFWIKPKHLEAQIGVSATSILTLVAFQFAIGVLLPKLNYLTRMDIFLLGSSVLIFLALVEAVLTSGLAEDGNLSAALKIDHYSKIIFFITFSVLMFVSFLIY